MSAKARDTIYNQALTDADEVMARYLGPLHKSRVEVQKLRRTDPMNPNSEQILTLVHPTLATKIKAAADLLMKLPNPIELRVVQGLRTNAQQDALYAQGRSVLTDTHGNKLKIVTNAKGGQSSHNYGLAVDVVPNVTGTGIDTKQWWQPDWDIASVNFKTMVAALKGQGLAWGGDWKTMKGDYDHFYLANTPANPSAMMQHDLATGGLTLIYRKTDEGQYS